MRHNMLVSVAGLCLVALATTHAFGAWSQTVDDSDASFSGFSSDLQVAGDGTAVGGSYHFITSWANSGGSQSGLVKYQLSGVPAGNNLYHISFSAPTNAAFGTPGSIAQWHIFNVSGDGTESFAQNIPWAGQFGTNKQWLGPGTDPYNPGGFTVLGPGPQNDTSLLDGTTVWLNGSGSQPYIYLTVQNFYSAPIAFDAITVTQVPEPATLALSAMGAVGLGLVAWRRRRAKSA